MTTLAKNEPRKIGASGVDTYGDLPVVQADIIYEGAAVGDNGSGYARPLVAADPFWGFATRKVDNSDGSNGDEDVHVQERGCITIPVTGVTGVGDVGDDVYATDDNTFTKTSSGASSIGTIVRHVSSTTCVVYFESVNVRSI